MSRSFSPSSFARPVSVQQEVIDYGSIVSPVRGERFIVKTFGAFGLRADVIDRRYNTVYTSYTGIDASARAHTVAARSNTRPSH